MLALLCLLSAPPNVVLILADDMGSDAVSAYNDRLGMQTPHIDRLAAGGMRFTDAHSPSSVCSPSRYALLTGRYAWRSRLKRGIVGKWERPLIADETLTMAEMFREAGYATACIGKWHLGWDWPKTDGEIDFTKPAGGGPIAHGFDGYFGDDVPNWPPYAWREDDRVLGEVTTTMGEQPVIGGVRMLGVREGPAVEGWDFRAVLRTYTGRWAGYIDEASAADRPYFLYAPMPSPHTPIAPHESFVGTSGVSQYADFLIQTDAAVGAILDAVDRSGEETMVLFTADNGTSPKADFAGLKAGGIDLTANWRGWKSDVFEGGHRVPLVVRWPGTVKAGSTSDEVVTLCDLVATLAAAIGVKLPLDAAPDSVSLLSILRGDHDGRPLHDVVVHHSGSGHFAVRGGDWKVLFARGSGGWSSPTEAEAKTRGLPPVQLYDLSEDARETANVAGDHPGVVTELTSDLRRVVERGRSTLGPTLPNHGGQTAWPGLPWAE